MMFVIILIRVKKVTLQFEDMLSHIALKGSVSPGDGSGSAVDAQLDTNTDSWALLSGSLEGVLKCCMSELKGD